MKSAWIFHGPSATIPGSEPTEEARMPGEEFTIRITKKGEILVELDGMPVQRVKDLLTYFEETLGPVKAIDPEGGDASGGVRLEDIDFSGQMAEEEAGEVVGEEEKRRLRREE